MAYGTHTWNLERRVADLERRVAALDADPPKEGAFNTGFELPRRMAEPQNFGAAVIADGIVWRRASNERWEAAGYPAWNGWDEIDDPQPFQNCTLTADDPEPPVESVVLDCEGDPWKRSSLEHEWCGVEGDEELPWRDLCYQFPPVTLLYRGEA